MASSTAGLEMERQAAEGLAPCSSSELLLYFLRLGTTGFGGPIALAGYMQRDLVEKRGWITKKDYVEGLALAQLAPGPLAAQLAIYLGWIKGRIFGATAVAAAFILPSFVMVLGLSALYVRFGGLPWMQSAFYGVGAAVVALIVRTAAARGARISALFPPGIVAIVAGVAAPGVAVTWPLLVKVTLYFA